MLTTNPLEHETKRALQYALLTSILFTRKKVLHSLSEISHQSGLNLKPLDFLVFG